MRSIIVRTAIALLLFHSPSLISQERRWSAREGVTIMILDQDKLNELGLVVTGTKVTDTSEIKGGLAFVVDLRSDLIIKTAAGTYAGVISGAIRHRGGFVLSARSNIIRITDFTVAPKNDRFEVFNASDTAMSSPLLSYSAGNASWSKEASILSVTSTDLLMTQKGAELLGIPQATGRPIGKVVVRLWASDANEQRQPEIMSAKVNEPTTQVASDLTFCQLYGLTQFGRLGNIVGLGVGTTSWNIGSARLDWFASPDWRHPFIVSNLYRVTEQRFEQIGQSWVKHGFFALSDSQCQPPSCMETTDGSQLGVGCTDTYSPSTNADQGSLGPRFEVNPWDGTWKNSQAWTTSDSVSHRLQVRDEDLDIARHPGATYLVEGYYVHYQDTDVTNSAAWKNFSPARAPGSDRWTFSMKGPGTRPNIGFAIEAWPGARREVLAQTVPPVKWQSPDGRCILAAKALDLGGGTWHYEYALLNVDMDRQVSSFSVALAPGATVSKAGFFGAQHHEELVNGVGGVSIDNSEWAFSETGGIASWQTSKNPLRWGTVYNFWFDADKGPGDVGISLGLFKPGTPTSISGVSTGPAQ